MILLVVMQCQNVIPITEEDQARFCEDQELKCSGDVPNEPIGKYILFCIFMFPTFQTYNSFSLSSCKFQRINLNLKCVVFVFVFFWDTVV